MSQSTAEPLLLVYVVSFSPAHNEGGAGGFVWDHDLANAHTYYLNEVGRVGEDSILRLVPMLVSPDEGGKITEEIDSRMEEVEGLLPALWQHVPENSYHRFVPSAPAVGRLVTAPTF